MILHNVQQRDPNWYTLRAGMPTASEFDRLFTSTFDLRKGDTVATYMYEKLAEKMLGHPLRSFHSGEMDEGNILEDEAIPYFEFRHDLTLKRPGFVTTDDAMAGCSPDAMLNEDHGLEIKCPQIHTHVRWLLGGTLPKEHAAQVHGCMYVTGARKWTFMSYNRKLDPLIIEVARDPEIMGKIDAGLKTFRAEFEKNLRILRKDVV